MAVTGTRVRGKSTATKLINLALASGGEFFRAPEGELYGTVPVGAHRETLPLADRAIKEWLARTYFIATKAGVSGSALADAVMALSGSARFQGIERPVFTRIAACDREVYLDLGRDDRLVLRLAADGWTVGVAPDDVRFVRRKGMLPLPVPVRGDSLTRLLEQVVNVESGGSDVMLMSAWLVGTLRGVKPYPILTISGEQGSAKTYACRILRQVIDPNKADLSLTPKEPRDLMIAALNSHVIGFDNLSFMPDWLSDVLCCLSTGAGFRTRTLMTDQEEMIFSAARPIVLNGITDIVRRGDLMDRSLSIMLRPIAERDRRTEASVDAAFGAARPAILAALADAVVVALREPVTLRELPRMADFAVTVESAAPALGWAAGAFLNVYATSRAEAALVLLEGDPVVTALARLRDADRGEPWSGTSDELRDRITGVTPEFKREQLPKSAKGLVGALRRLAPGLRSTGTNIRLPEGQERSGDRRGQRLIRIDYSATGQLHLAYSGGSVDSRGAG